MAAETLTQSPLPVAHTHGYAGNVKRQWFYYDIAADVEDGDIFELGYLPANCVVTGGHVAAADIDTGTEAIDIDVGWAANSGASTDTWIDPQTQVTLANSGATADPDGFCNTGVLTGDGSAEIYQAGVNYRQFVFVTPLYFSHKTKVQLEANAAAGTFTAGRFSVYIDYYLT
jgi:hypothetical protein